MTYSHMGNRYHDPVNDRMHVRHMVGGHNSAIDNEVVSSMKSATTIAKKPATRLTRHFLVNEVPLLSPASSNSGQKNAVSFIPETDGI
ncbi:hypothetical protein [Endozoicomonas euniceicola]|uniref:Uncharacterized protein n=1 Tax=Endozoicomonas euniceicola TaxID=1234143 RepID=A0ABY6GZW8_9GAMM|nr:hypothetical protein [Endozoicomonas euniceicola]UYM17591.1 hypothetical protein NX720_06685 [Endozoicomonas euniceicola]